MKKILLSSAIALGVAVNAMAVTITNIELNGSAEAGTTVLTFDSGALGDSNVTVALGTYAQAVTGNGGSYAAPYGDSTRYLTTGTSAITFTFTETQDSFGLLWGSVDAYNHLYFYNDGALVGSFSGTNVQTNANGAQGNTGTFYVTFGGLYDTVVASSTSNAFEFDNVSYHTVPDTASTLALFGTALLGLAAIARRRS